VDAARHSRNGSGNCVPYALSIAALFRADAPVGVADVKEMGSRLSAGSIAAPQRGGGRLESSASPGAAEVWGQLIALSFDVIQTNDALKLGQFLHR
jgi:hypothetical protein